MSKPVPSDVIRAGERISAAMRSSSLAPACFAQAIGTFTLVLVGHAVAAAAVPKGRAVAGALVPSQPELSERTCRMAPDGRLLDGSDLPRGFRLAIDMKQFQDRRALNQALPGVPGKGGTMVRAFTVMAVAAGMLATAPAMARQGPRGTPQDGSRRETVPLRVKDDQVADMQQKLNDQGFSAGQVDGLWGPDTSAALRRYQAKKGLRQTGQLDQGTLAALGAPITIAAPLASPAQAAAAPAQPVPVPASPAPAPTPPGSAPRASAPIVATTPGAPASAAPGVDTSIGGSPAASLAGRNTGAAGDRNQAVATTAANAPQPAKGANSFSRGEARRRIERAGFAGVADLQKDGDGVWRGRGTKDGSSVGVWLDYKGNVGQQ